jgi:hypothetical protein
MTVGLHENGRCIANGWRGGNNKAVKFDGRRRTGFAASRGAGMAKYGFTTAESAGV